MFRKYEPATFTFDERDVISREVRTDPEEIELGIDPLFASHEYVFTVRHFIVNQKKTPEYQRLVNAFGESEADRIIEIAEGGAND